MDLRQLLLVMSALFAVVLLHVAGCGGMPAIPDPPQPVIDDDVSIDNSKESGIHLEWLDETIMPQQDFYGYSCGGWMNTTAVPDGWASYSGFDAYYDLLQEDLLSLFEGSSGFDFAEADAARLLFQSGLDVEAIEAADIDPIADELEMIDGIHDAESFSFALGRLQQIGVTPFIKIHRPVSWELLDRNYIYLRQTGLGIADGLAGWHEVDDDAVSAEKLYISQLLIELGYSDTAAVEYADEIISLEQRLAEYSMSDYQMRDFTRNYNPLSSGELRDLCSEIIWDEFMSGLGVPFPSRVVVGQLEYFNEVNSVIAEFDLDFIKAYLKWSLAAEFAPAMSERFAEPALVFNSSLYEYGDSSREYRMLAVVRREMPDILGAMYLEKFFTDSTRESVETIIANLKVAYDARLRNSTWLDEQTRAHALAKLAAVTFAIGGPEAPDYYTDLELDESSFLPNILATRRLRTAEHLSHMDELRSDDVWFLESYVANRWSLPSANTVLLPAAGINELFRPDYDNPYNYGAFGSTIAHEITHLFDRTGRTIDEQCRQRNWWTDDDLQQYEQLTAALGNYYSFLGESYGMELDGVNMFDENFADVMGLRVAYDAYQIGLNGASSMVKNDFTGEQRLFLANAQKWRVVYTSAGLDAALNAWHSPGQIRAAGPAFICPAFSEVFPGSEEDSMTFGDNDLELVW